MGEHGQGTIVPIETRRKDGSVRLRIRVAVTMSDGRRVWRTVRNEREAERERTKLLEARELELDPARLRKQTTEAYLRSWITAQRDAKRRRIRERTLLGYERLIEQRILPELGRVKLGQLNRRRIQSWIDRQDGSAGTVRNAHAVLRKALAAAVGDVLASNPAIGAELPERPRYAGAPRTANEARRLLEATEGDRLHAFWRLALVTGLREGELLGLPRDAIHGSTLTVAHQLQRIGGHWALGPTKTARSIDQVALDPKTVDVIARHLRDRAAERTPSWRFHGLMFVTERGDPYHQSTVLAEFRRACVAAAIAPRRVHDLRHTNNRLMKDRMVPKEVRKARMGHSTDEMTERYGGASEVLDRAAVEEVAEAIGG